MNKRLGYYLGFLILAMLYLCVLGVGYIWYHRELQRLTLAERLGLKQNSTWEAIESYLDCQYIRTGMSLPVLEHKLRQLGDYRKTPFRHHESNFTIHIMFRELPTINRYYTFYEGRLWNIAEPAFGSGAKTISCDW